MTRRFRLIAAVSLTVGALALSGCTADKADNGKPLIVASTNVWGSIATAIAGDDASVTSLIGDANADPHSFELSPAQAAELSDADLVVFNGGGYDPYIDQVLESVPDVASVNAFDLRANKADENEHVWFDYPTVLATAQSIADELAEADPAHADDYQNRAEKFEADLKPVQDAVSNLAADHAGTAISETEPLPHYLVVAGGLDDLTPESFQEAIEEVSDPSPASTAAFGDLLTSKKVAVLIYNIQSEDGTTAALRKMAEDAGVRVIEVTETLPAGQSYLEWQMSTVEQLSAALQ